MYALVDINGKQYKAEQGATIKVDRLDQAKGENVEFATVLMTSKDGEVKVGTPYVKGAAVKAVVQDAGRDGKILVFKYRKRKSYRRRQGHRQDYTLLRVQEITGA